MPEVVDENFNRKLNLEVREMKETYSFIQKESYYSRLLEMKESFVLSRETFLPRKGVL